MKLQNLKIDNDSESIYLSFIIINIIKYLNIIY